MGTSSTSCQRLRTTNVLTMATRALTLAGWVPMRQFLTCHRAWLTQRLRPLSKPVLEGMIKEGRPYLGVLYAGLILTVDGPKVIEFNSRFGDPETQIILPRLTSDFAQNITDILDGKEPEITWTDKGVTLGVVVASNGYPLDYEKVLSCQPRQKVTSSPTMPELSFRKIAEHCYQTADVSICSSPQPIPSKKPKKPSIKNSLNKTQKVSSTEQISEARQLSKDIRITRRSRQIR